MAFFNQTEEQKLDNSLWVERYRPKALEDYIGNDIMKDKIQSFIDNDDIPHLLFHGRAGTGKTSISKLIVNSIDCDYMYINASDERNTDTIRDKVKGFAASMGFKKWKVVILDEVDFMNYLAQPMLRNIMETFSQHTRFILTCNYVERIIEPIQSRCQTFHVIPPSKKDIAIHINKILLKENIKFDIKDLVPIIDSSYPDIRKIINTCQLNSVKGVLKIDTANILENDYKQKVLEILKSKSDKKEKYTNIRKTISASKVTDFTDLYSFLYEKLDDYAAGSTSLVILKLAEGQYRSTLSVDKEIPTMAAIIEILNII